MKRSKNMRRQNVQKLLSAALAITMALSLGGCKGEGTGSTKAVSNDNTGAREAMAESVLPKTSSGWPDKPITLLVGYSAGGSSDLGCRYLAGALEKQLGVPIVVENLPGSGSTLAWTRLLKNSEPDGNTFAMVNLSIVYGAYDETNPRDYTIDSFDLLANHVIDYQAVAIRRDDPRFNDYASLIEYGKNEKLIAASATTTITSGDATVAKMMEKEFGCNITLIPVEGAGDSETMFLAGETDFLIGNVGDMMDAEDNGYKVVVVFGEERSEFLPDVPTAIELGIGDYVSFSARGYAYMPGVDDEIRELMITALENAFADPDYQKNMRAMGAELVMYSGEDYYKLLMDQLDQRLEIWNVPK